MHATYFLKMPNCNLGGGVTVDNQGGAKGQPSTLSKLPL